MSCRTASREDGSRLPEIPCTVNHMSRGLTSVKITEALLSLNISAHWVFWRDTFYSRSPNFLWEAEPISFPHLGIQRWGEHGQQQGSRGFRNTSPALRAIPVSVPKWRGWNPRGRACPKGWMCCRAALHACTRGSTVQWLLLLLWVWKGEGKQLYNRPAPNFPLKLAHEFRLAQAGP